MKVITAFLFVFSFSLLNARNNYESDYPVKDSIFSGLNEVYLNVGPLLSWSQGAMAENGMKWNFMYKRIIKNGKFSFRAGVMYTGIKYGYYNYKIDSYNHSNSSIVYYDVTDSTRTGSYTGDRSVRKIQLNLGMEYRKLISKRWMAFTAMDIFLGNHSIDHVHIMSYEIQLDNGQWWRKELGESDRQQSTNIYLGVSPKLGMGCSINSHWMVSLQTALLATYSFGYIPNSAMRLRGFDYNIKGIVDELNLVYRF